MADLTIPLTAVLAYLGYKLNNGSEKTQRPVTNIRKEISPHELPSGTNIYDSHYSKKIKEDERKLLDTEYLKALDPKNTNKLPAYYNSYCQVDCPEPKTIIKQNSVLPSVSFTPVNNNYLLSGPLFDNTKLGYNNQKKVSNFKENFENISPLTGQRIITTHNNMVPFYRGELKQDTRNNTYEHTLEKYTGRSNVLPEKKQAVKALFKPTQDQVFGSAPITTTINTNRFFQSNLKTSLLPFEQVRVQPLPQETVRPSFKTIDDLNVKQRLTFNQPIKSGKAIVGNRGMLGAYEKNKNDTYYENSEERYYGQVSQTKKQYSRQNFDLSKSCTKSDLSATPLNLNPGHYINKGRRVQPVKESVDNSVGLQTVVIKDNKHLFDNDYIRNIKGESRDNFNNREGYRVVEQERNTTNKVILNPGQQLSKGTYHAFTDKAKSTNKENNLYSYVGNPNQDSKGMVSREKYENSNTLTNRAKKLNYVSPGQKEIVTFGASDLNANLKQELDTGYRLNPAKRVNQTTPRTNGLLVGLNDNNKTLVEHDFTERINSDLLQSLKSNPFVRQ